MLRALLHGVPVLCIPSGRDQFDNAQRLVHRGAGLKLRRGASIRSIRAEADHGARAADAIEHVVVGPH